MNGVSTFFRAGLSVLETIRDVLYLLAIITKRYALIFWSGFATAMFFFYGAAVALGVLFGAQFMCILSAMYEDWYETGFTDHKGDIFWYLLGLAIVIGLIFACIEAKKAGFDWPLPLMVPPST